ncbi:MAG: M20/M25/M40 family metallo-hydrolase, partial [Terriglobia bacterium]
MIVRTRRGALAAAVLGATLMAPLAAQQRTQEPLDYHAIYRIKEEGFQRSQVMEIASYLTDVHGPRLTNSPGFNAAADWVVEQSKKWGLESAAKEKWGPYGRGWSASHLSAHLREPQDAILIGVPLAWTPGTNGMISGAPLYAPLRRDQDFNRYRAYVEAYMMEYKGKLKGQIVLLGERPEVKVQETAAMRRYSANELSERAAAPEPVYPIAIDFRNPVIPTDPEERRRFNAYAPRYVTRIFAERREELRNRLNRFLVDEGARLIIHPAQRGDGGTIFPPVVASYRANAVSPPPSIALTPEHYNRIVRLLDEKVPVRIEVDSKAQFHQDTLDSVNVVAEIPGGSKRDELVIIGAHLDSVEAAGTGATDNAAGSAVMMEVMRILKTLNLPMDRTVRMVLWGGEEEGLLGSRAYVKKHFGDIESMKLTPEHSKVAAYYNFDNGTGKIRGVYLQENDMVRPIFDSWLAPFRDLGATTLASRRTGGTDHLSFDELGIPGFQFIQD